MRAIWVTGLLCAACGPGPRNGGDTMGNGAIDASCVNTCSTDLRSVVDCQGNVVQACAASDQCDNRAAQCTNACAAAESIHRSVGCDYYATYMDSIEPNNC